MWVNGHNLGRYPEKIRIDSLYIPECWLKAGTNELNVFDETGASPALAGLLVEQAASREVIRASEAVDPATPIVVPLENPPRDLKAMNAGNLAFNCPATASASTTGSSAGAVTDGDPDTTWVAPAGTPNPSVRIDLGKSVGVGTCEIIWDQASKKYAYVLEGSDDGQAWTKLGDAGTAVPTSPDSPSELSRLNLSGQPFRYLRVTINSGPTLSIAEVRVFGDSK